MKVRIEDRELLNTIDPLALRAYVTGQGWEQEGSFKRGKAILGHVFIGPLGYEILVPNSVVYPDYAAVVGQAIEALAAVENRDELQVLKDVQVSAADVLRVRSPEAGDDGSIEIEHGVGLFRNSHDLLLSAACAVGNGKRYFKMGSVARANEYMGGVRLGQTEIGSYIVRLLSPVPPELRAQYQPTFWPELELEPFQRQVTRVLMDALDQVQNALRKVNQGEGVEAFEEAVPRGVSANLCTATAALIESGNGLDLSMTWAQTRRTPEPRQKYTFGKEDSRILREAAKVLKETAPRPDERLSGFVTKLARTVEQELGTATFKVLLDEKLASITTQLDQDLYTLASAANNDRSTIEISGDLVREGQRWRLTNPRNLQVIPDDQE